MQRLIYCLALAWFDQVRSWSHHSHRLTSVNQSETSKLDNWPIRVQVMTGHDPLIFITLDVTTSHMYSYTTYNFYCSTNKQSVKKITWKKYGSGILTRLDSLTRHCQRVENVMKKQKKSCGLVLFRSHQIYVIVIEGIGQFVCMFAKFSSIVR